MPGLYKDGRLRPRRICGGCCRTRHAVAAAPIIATGDAVDLPCVVGRALQRIFRWCEKSSNNPASASTRRRRSQPVMTLGGAPADPRNAALRSNQPARDSGRPKRSKGLALSPAAVFTDNIPRVLPNISASASILLVCRCLPVFKWLGGAGRHRRTRNCLRTFNCGIGMIAIVKPDAIERVTDVFHPRPARAVALLGRSDPRRGRASRGL